MNPQVRRILSIDGMSAAAVQIRLLHHYEARCPGFLQSVDCYAGASDGGYIALYLAANVTDDHVQNLAMLDRAVTFSNQMIPLFRLTPLGMTRFLSGRRPLLSGPDFRDFFQEHFGALHLRDLRRKVVIAAAGALNWGPRVFTNLECDSRFCPDTSFSLVDVALATSALPMALPMVRVQGVRLIDGGWLANNPTLIAISAVCEASRARGGDGLDGLRVLSLGATENATEYQQIVGPEDPREDWGWIQWLVRRPLLLMEATLQGGILLAHHHCTQLLGDRYRRIDPPLGLLRDLLHLLFSREDRLATKFDTEAHTLCADSDWSEPHCAWIRDTFLALETS